MNDRLTPELVLSAYCQGCFPMADPETGEISFYEPDPRALIPLDDRFHIPHGLKRALNKKPFELRMDTAFPEVVHACARTDQPEEQWIDGQIEEAYGKLHEMGFAHSVECWDEEGLQGGLYGVALGKAFFGESMFHRKTDASKIAASEARTLCADQVFMMCSSSKCHVRQNRINCGKWPGQRPGYRSGARSPWP